MKRPFVILFIVLFVTCSPKRESTADVVASTMVDSIVTKAEGMRCPDSAFSINTTIVPDSSLYIGEVRSFPETAELYTSVYFRDDVNTEGLLESLIGQTDSLVYEDIERRRKRLSTKVARSYFNLLGLDSISVYKQGRLLCKAKFVRVEFYSDLVEGQFVAVFRPAGLSTVPDRLDYYCISAGPHPYDTVDISYEAIEDERLTKDLLTTIAADSQRIWSILHTRITPYNSIYSAISMESRLLLIETNGGKSRVLKDLNEDWFILDITPLHLESNGKPVLLLRMGVNETDMIWNSLAVFSGKEYVFMKNNRVTNPAWVEE